MIRRDGKLVHEAIFGPLLAFGALLAVTIPDWLPRLPCVMRRLTGIPCLTCGSTRAVLALARFDVVEALTMNPLTTLLAIFAVGYVVHAALVLAGLRRPWIVGPLGRFGRAAVVLAIAVNWSYLFAVGR